IVATGVLLAAAVLFRRHFLFAAAGLFATIGLTALLAARGASRELRKLLAAALGVGVRIVLAVAAGSAAALLVARPAALRFVQHDFYGLYTAYLNPPGLVARQLVEQYGALAVGGAMLGFGIGWRTGVLDPRRTLFAVTFGLVCFIQWAVVVRQVGEQYTLQFTPIVVLGLTALGWTLWSRGPAAARPAVAWVGSAFMAANLVFGLGAGAWFVNADALLRLMMAPNWPPLLRWDHDEMARLVDALRGLTTPEDPVFVAASSTTLNPDLLLNAERELHGWSAASLNVVNS